MNDFYSDINRYLTVHRNNRHRGTGGGIGAHYLLDYGTTFFNESNSRCELSVYENGLQRTKIVLSSPFRQPLNAGNFYQIKIGLGVGKRIFEKSKNNWVDTTDQWELQNSYGNYKEVIRGFESLSVIPEIKIA